MEAEDRREFVYHRTKDNRVGEQEREKGQEQSRRLTESIAREYQQRR